MRAPAIVIAAVALVALGAACSPYSPSLGKEPFLCGSSAPKCPDGYSCTGMNGSGQGVCLENGGTTPDAGSANGMCNNDTALMNDSLSMAYVTPVDNDGTKNMVMYTGLGICTVGVQQFFSFTVSPSSEAFRSVVTYGSGAWGAPMEANVLNMTGIAVYPFTAVSGSADTLRAFAANIASGTYIVEVEAAAGSNSGINNYTLEIDLCADSTTAPCNM